MTKLQEIAKSKGVSKEHLVEILSELTMWPYIPLEEAIKNLDKQGEI